MDIQELNDMCELEKYGTGSARRMFAKIPLNVNSNEFMFFDKIFCQNVLNPPRARVQRLTVSFRFHDGTPVDFNGAEHSLTIELMCTDARATSRF